MIEERGQGERKMSLESWAGASHTQPKKLVKHEALEAAEGVGEECPKAAEMPSK